MNNTDNDTMSVSFCVCIRGAFFGDDWTSLPSHTFLQNDTWLLYYTTQRLSNKHPVDKGLLFLKNDPHLLNHLGRNHARLHDISVGAKGHPFINIIFFPFIRKNDNLCSFNKFL
jgi:hypothetical protein